MQVINPSRPGVYPILFEGNVFAAFSGRVYPREQFCGFLQNAGLNPDSLVRPKQVHGDEIVVVSAREVKKNSDSTCAEADAIVTNLSGHVLGILTADCIPAFFWDPIQKAAGLAHAGWRGLKAGILEKTIQQMGKIYNSRPENIQAAFGPFIRACCYEVGKEFAEHFPSFYKPFSPEKGYMDMTAAGRDRLRQVGIRVANFQDTGLCTLCRREAFFSARAGDASERILSVIQIR